MGRAARIKREFNAAMNKAVQPKLPATMQKIEREIRRDGRVAKHNYAGRTVLEPIPTFKEWPCQMSTGKALLPIEVIPYTKEDGKLYYAKKDGTEQLVVCENYLIEQKRIAFVRKLKEDRLNAKKATEMTPTPLGDNA